MGIRDYLISELGDALRSQYGSIACAFAIFEAGFKILK